MEPQYILGDLGFIASRGKDLSLLQNAPTSYGAHVASYWIFWSLTLHSGEVKNEWSCTSTPLNVLMASTLTLPLFYH